MGDFHGEFLPMGDFHGELLRKSFAFNQFSIFSHAVKKLINALYVSKICTIHIFELLPRISRTRYTFLIFHGGFFPWGIPMGNFYEINVLHEFLLFLHAVKKLINALSISTTCTIHIFVLNPAISRTRYTFCKIPHGEFSPHGELPMGIFTKTDRAHSILNLFSCGKEINKCFIYI